MGEMPSYLYHQNVLDCMHTADMFEIHVNASVVKKYDPMNSIPVPP